MGSSFQEPWRKNVKFIQPYYVVELVHRDEHDGFNDWQLFDVPPEIDVNYLKHESLLLAQYHKTLQRSDLI